MASVNDSAAAKRLRQARLSFMTMENKSGSADDKVEESLPVKKTSIAAKLARFAVSPVPPEDDMESTPQPNENPESKSAEEVKSLSDDSDSVVMCEPRPNENTKTGDCILDTDTAQPDSNKTGTDRTAKSKACSQEKPHETSLLESLEDSDYAESVSNDSDNPDVAEASVTDDPLNREANQLSCDGEDDSEEKSTDGNGSNRTPTASKTPKSKKMTPKMLEKEAERQRKREEKQLEKEEKQREKEEKERLKAEAKAQKELLKKQKQEALEAKAALKKKAEEEKEMEKKLRAEEKQRMEDEKKRQEEEERKKKERVSQAFTSFFTPKAKKTQPVCVTIASSRKLAFEPFQIKAGMRLASILRTSFPEERKNSLTALLNDQSHTSPTYLAQLKKSQYTKGKSGPTWPRTKETDEVEVVDDEEAIVINTKASVEVLIVESHAPCKKIRAKLLQFRENRRPPYWGTWSKRPSHINPRRPFAKEDVFDYEVDSDDEWEEEEPGESVSDSEGEEKEPEDDYEVDNEFFVPHGYLSDEEARDDNDEVMSPERMKASLKAKEAEFEEERKKKTCHLKARLIGCIWMDQVENNPDLQQVLKVMNQYRAVPCVSVPINLSQLNVHKSEDGASAEEKKSESKKSKKKAFSDKDLPDLVRLFHGNMKNKKFLVKEFRAHLLRKHSAQVEGDISAEIGKDLGESEPRYTGPSLAAIENKAAEIAEWKHCNELNRKCWVVKTEVLESCGLTDQSAANSWQYVLPVKQKTKTPIGDAYNSKPGEDCVKEEETESCKPKAKVSLIKQFMQPSTGTQKDAGPDASESKPKKRIQLIPLAPVNKKPKLDTETVTLD